MSAAACAAVTGAQLGGYSAPRASYGLNMESELNAGRGCSGE